MANLERIKAHFDVMRKFTATPNAGMTRLSYSPEDIKTRNYIKAKMEEYGLRVWEDGLGNIFGKLAGTIPDAPSVLVGSHFDSVPNGGIFDGVAGVVAGLEVAALFQEQNIKPAYPLEVIAMVEEEGTRFGSGLMGSRGIHGILDKEDFQKMRDKEGISVVEAMKQAGLDPSQPVHRHPKTMKAFLELHIEQGPVLEKEKISLGIVDKIVGMCQLEVTVKGKAGHAGTTPMDMRQDALVVAAKIVAQLPDLVKNEEKGTVITTGQLNVYPNGANVIPEKVVFTIDLRSGDEETMERVLETVEKFIQAEEKAGINIDIEQKLWVPPKKLNEQIHHLLQKSAEKLGITYMTMPSGAGHDAMIFSDFTDTGLIFIPSKNGISHHPDEWSEFEDIARGIDVLFEAVKVLTE